LVVFAAFLFEADPPERYMAAFPLLFLAFGYILADRNSSRFPRLLLGLFFLSMIAVNLSALSRFRHDEDLEAARPRLQALNQRLQPQDEVLVLSYKDPVLRLVNAEPFSPDSKNRYLITVGLPWGQARQKLWAAQFAEMARNTWERGGNLWLSRRFLAAQPDPAWGWVEGDLRGVAWPDLPAFFGQLDLTDSVGGPDGFSEVTRTAHNADLMNGSKFAR
jgi:hypothetical protein